MSTKPTTTDPKPTTTKKNSGRSLFNRLLITVLLIAVFIEAAYFINQTNQLKKINLLQMHQNQSQSQQQLQQIEQLSARVNQIQQATTPTEDYWLILQANFLIQSANDQINLTENTQTAEKLLITADKKLATINNSKVVRVRKLLSKSILQLKAANTFDTTGVYLKIDADIAAIDQLQAPIAGKNQPAETPATNASPPLPTSLWKKGLNSTLGVLKDLVIVRQQSTYQFMVLNSDQQQLLRLLIKSKLSQAQWALLHKSPTIFATNIKQSKQLVGEFFGTNSTVYSSLVDLEKIDINPKLTNLDELLTTMNKLVTQQ